MKKVVVLGSKNCPDCSVAKEALSNAGITYEYLDISENILNLKMFLRYRDNNPIFDKVKEKGGVGIPCIVTDNGKTVFLDFGEEVLKELKGGL